MTRKRIRHEEILNEENRNAMLRKRTDGLLKKARELTILCGVDLAITIHKKDQNNAVLWPSPATFGERLQKFLDSRSEERERRTVTHVSHMEQMVQGEIEEIAKLNKAIQFKESQQLMVKAIQSNSFDGVNLNQLNEMKSFADAMLKRLADKKNEVNAAQ